MSIMVMGPSSNEQIRFRYCSALFDGAQCPVRLLAGGMSMSLESGSILRPLPAADRA
jgi:hypothetical protein